MPQQPSYERLYKQALQATCPAEANRWYTAICDIMQITALTLTRDEADKVIRESLGYMAGYHDVKLRERVERLYGAKHPILGSIAELGPPTFSEVFQLGVNNGGKKGPQTLKELRNEKKRNEPSDEGSGGTRHA